MTVSMRAAGEQLTANSFGFKIVTLPTVASSLLGRINAVPACSANAFEFAVEKIAVPLLSVAEGVSAFGPKSPGSRWRAASAPRPRESGCSRSFSVSRVSPDKTVVPTEAVAVPT